MIELYERLFVDGTDRATQWARLGLFSCLFWVLGVLCLSLAPFPGGQVSLWLPNALAIAALVRLDYSRWWWPLAALMGANFLALLPFMTAAAAVAYTPIHLVEITFGAMLLRQCFRGEVLIQALKPTLYILLLGVVITPVFGATASAFIEWVRGASALDGWIRYYIADAVGLLIMLPLALNSSIRGWHVFLASSWRNPFHPMLLLTLIVNVLALPSLPMATIYCGLPLLIGALVLDFFRSTLLNAVSMISLIALLFLSDTPVSSEAALLDFESQFYLAAALIVLPALLLGVLMQSNRWERQRLRDNELRWKMALDGSGQGVWEIELPDGDLQVSMEARRMLGLPREQAIFSRSEWLDIVHPEDIGMVRSRLQAHIAGETELYLVEYRMYCPEAGYRWFQIRGRIMAHDELERPQRLIGTIIDVTAAKSAELERVRLSRALQEETERLQVTLSSIGDGVIATDDQARINFMNPTAEGMTGWSLEQARHHAIESIFNVVSDGTEHEVPLVNPVRECLQRSSVFSREDDLVLIGREGERFDVNATAAPVRADGGRVLGAILVFQNVSRARELQRSLSFTASHDALTGIFNRARFEQVIEEALGRARREGSRDVLCMIDLDRFKVVNDSAGHVAGDHLLTEVSALLGRHVRHQDILARLGGDEFGLLLIDCTLDQARQVADKLIELICALRFVWEGNIYDIGASIGMVAIEAETTTFGELLGKADIACYAAKRAGRNRSSTFEPGQQEVEREHRDIFMAAGLREAIEADRFVLYSQRIMHLHEGAGEGEHHEILLRMQDKDEVLVPPGAFIPVAERYGMMAAIDCWVIEQLLCRRGEEIATCPTLQLSINLSANSLSDATFLPWLLALMGRSPVPPGQLIFEITETALMNHVSMASEAITALRELGCRVALDDFGSGLSSFSYLQSFSVDLVKIDGAFVRNVCSNELDQVIVDSINQIAHRLGAATVAEFVENAATLERIRDMGVDYVQGYHVAMPEPLECLLLPRTIGS
ncbi:PAS domain S-box-containing protein/diguanylate cyclase (GGDEF)-like protein [Kushneria sinocarnis]|uniref:PAS domain S-box-containing protein/diguanylate cyclase (GGDEF)-like protein n=1 Tax=Kushneria sinocarnis TaxID=595502 RepID=A0A420WSU4_9GAMM|nr:EAL domain-containing protein [Kushneria sinocarnis]RKQ95840.1 PAS domain S-box-containing protein/diguanylate cyclase (GGDEF)-like protein [Kushneria sinocarnis]